MVDDFYGARRKNVKQLHGKKRSDHVLRTTISGLKGTVKSIVKDKRLLFFMLAFFFYIDGVHTVIKMSTSYGTDLGIDSTQLVLALLVTQFVAFPSAIAYGNLAKRFGTKRHAEGGRTCVLLYRAIAAFFLKRAVEFWILAICVGLFRADTRRFRVQSRQAHSEGACQRSTTGSSTSSASMPPVMGTFLVSAFTQLTGSSSLGVLSIALLFIVGFLFLRAMPPMLGDS